MMTDPFLWTLVVLQLFMGAFDVLFHHEFTERLSWRASAANELALHGARNLLYGALFFVFAWFEPRGLFALAFAGILIVEIVVTLWDFVEEDMTRKLPSTERVLHTLLAINYGGIMALVLPVLFEWAKGDTAFTAVTYGWGSALLTFAAAGVTVFAAHDFMSRSRVRALAGALRPARELADTLERRYRVVITGGTGFIGTRLAEALSEAGHAVIIQTREPARTAQLKPPFTVVTDLTTLPKSLEVDAVVNLAGEPLATGLWTRRKRFRAFRSRLKAARAVGNFIRHLDKAPEVLVAASAIGFYGLRDDESLSEADIGKDCFSHRLTKAVEEAAEKAAGDLTRVVSLRIGLVLGTTGGILANLLPAFDWCAGGPIASGRQWMSWIERDDMVRLILHAIAFEDLRGAVNAVAPTPVRNGEFAQTLGRVMGRPAVVPVPSFVTNQLLGDMGRELLASGQRVKPMKAQVSGFTFDHPDLEGALRYCLGRKAIPAHGERASHTACAGAALSAGSRSALPHPDNARAR